MLPWTMLTFASEVADVGLRPSRWSIELAALARRQRWLTKVETCEPKSSGHDGEENLPRGQSHGWFEESSSYV